MSNPAQLPAFPSPDLIFRPVSREYPDGHQIPEHWHEGAQLIHAVSGVMELGCGQGFWVISPQQALWMPAHLTHCLRARGKVLLRTVYVRPDACPAGFPDSPRSLVVSPLLRELLSSALPVCTSSAPESRAAHLMHLLLDEIQWAQAVPLRLPMPRDARLQKLCLALLRAPGDQRSLTQWGDAVGASSRTLTRLFKAELGSSFLLWRQQARVFAAIPRLNQGEAVARIAGDLGYDSAGAFATAFRRLMGRSPRDYRPQPG